MKLTRLFGLSQRFSVFMLLFFATTASAQYTPWQTSTEFYTQLFNVGANASGAYYLGNSNTSSFVAGTQKDTTCSGCTFAPLDLILGTFVHQAAPKQDSILPRSIAGAGSLTVGVRVYLATLTATTSAVVHSTLYQSSTGQAWDFQPVSGVAVLTLTATTSNTVTPVTGNWPNVTKSGLYYMVGSTATGDTAAVQCDLYYVKTQSVQVTPGK